jgi:hypothetical protein
MKTTVILFVTLMMSILTSAQTQPQFNATGTQASSSLYIYLCEHIQCPGVTTTCFRPGTEMIAFVVTPSGELTDFRVVSSVSERMDEEMIRVLKTTSGQWQPGRIDGKAVAMEHEVALSFMPRHFDPVQEATRYLARGNSLIYKNPRRALRFINEAHRLFPCSESVLVARSVCRKELGDETGAQADCDCIAALNRLRDQPNDIRDPENYFEYLAGDR